MKDSQQRKIWAAARKKMVDLRIWRKRLKRERRAAVLRAEAEKRKVDAMCPEERAEYFKFVYERKLADYRSLPSPTLYL